MLRNGICLFYIENFLYKENVKSLEFVSRNMIWKKTFDMFVKKCFGFLYIRTHEIRQEELLKILLQEIKVLNFDRKQILRVYFPCIYGIFLNIIREKILQYLVDSY